MIRIDTRAGSHELITPLTNLGMPVEAAFLDAGDVEFVGNGPSGASVVLVEYKKLGDLFQCMRNGRFADQLRKMKDAGDHNWLLIEGRVRGFRRGSRIQTMGKTGRWRHQKGGITYQEMVGWSLTMAAVAGVMVWRTESQEESVEWVRGLYQWWTAKEWGDHRAHLDFYTPPPLAGNPLLPPTPVEVVAPVLPRVGPTKGLRVAERFKTVLDMVKATEAQWREIKGIGEKDAKTIWKWLRR